MLSTYLNQKSAYLHQIDPRIRIITAVIFSFWIVWQQQVLILLVALLISFILIQLAQLPISVIFPRLRSLNGLLILMWLILPLSVSENQCIYFNLFSISCAGIHWALLITLKANAIMLSLTALIATIEVVILGYALSQLYVPAKMIHLLLFTTRYLTILQQTYHQLRQAMRVRCFTMKTNWHSYRSIGYLIGMLLVRSFARAQRIEMAMKCRGYTGRFHLMPHLAIQQRDKVFLVLFLSILILITLVFS